MPRELLLKPDAHLRKKLFIQQSLVHPAKAHLGMIWELIESFSSPGEILLDPLGGVGSLLFGCLLGRNVIIHELEPRWLQTITGFTCSGKVEVRVFPPRIVSAHWEVETVEGKQFFETEEEALEYSANYPESFLEDPKLLYVEEHEEPEAKLTYPAPCGKMRNHAQHWVDGSWKKLVEHGPLLGYEMGSCLLIQGDAQKLSENLKQPASSVLTSPTYEESIKPTNENYEAMRHEETITKSTMPAKMKRLRGWQFGIGTGYTLIATSPPYEGVADASRNTNTYDFARGFAESSRKPMAYSPKVISTSPPYESSIVAGNFHERGRLKVLSGTYRGQRPDVWVSEKNVGGFALGTGYSPEDQQFQIGNMKKQQYWAAMTKTYRECFKVLEPAGWMIVIVKDFIRKKQIVPFTEQTAELLTKLGFQEKDRWSRKLWHQGFWRRQQIKHGLPEIDREWILISQKPA